jgi:hypothetical protein
VSRTLTRTFEQLDFTAERALTEGCVGHRLLDGKPFPSTSGWQKVKSYESAALSRFRSSCILQMKRLSL